MLFQSLTRDSNHSNTALGVLARYVPVFQSLTRDSNHSNTKESRNGYGSCGFNPSRGIAIIQTEATLAALDRAEMFQSLTRDSNHSNSVDVATQSALRGFNPSRGIAIIQTWQAAWLVQGRGVSIPHAG